MFCVSGFLVSRRFGFSGKFSVVFCFCFCVFLCFCGCMCCGSSRQTEIACFHQRRPKCAIRAEDISFSDKNSSDLQKVVDVTCKEDRHQVPVGHKARLSLLNF